MEKQQNIYRCTECDTTAAYPTEWAAPSCCGKTMVKDPLPYCTSADQAEMVRNEDAGEPCDDGRADAG